jgi:hypothetical protein
MATTTFSVTANSASPNGTYGLQIKAQVDAASLANEVSAGITTVVGDLATATTDLTALGATITAGLVATSISGDTTAHALFVTCENAYTTAASALAQATTDNNTVSALAPIIVASTNNPITIILDTAKVTSGFLKQAAAYVASYLAGTKRIV